MSVSLFEADTDYNAYINNMQLNKGMCELSPLSCVVTEEAGGEYGLTMVHPYDKDWKWQLLAVDRLIKASVPVMHLPEVTYAGTIPFQANTSANLYSKVESTALREDLDYWIRYRPADLEWEKKKEYTAGDYVICNVADVEHSSIARKIFQAAEDNSGIKPASEDDDGVWTDKGNLYDRHVPTDDGVVLATIPQGEVVMRLGEMIDDFIYVERSNGQRGFVHSSDFTIVASGGFTVSYGSRRIDQQFFRIYELVYDDDEQIVTAKARHVSYDSRKNALYRCVVRDETAQNAIASIVGKRVDETLPLTIVTDLIDDDITADWSFFNPVKAILDPEEGLAGKTKAKVIRDNGTFYLLQNTDNSHGFVIQYGKNLLGVNYIVNYDDVVTRVMPVANDGFDGWLYTNPPYFDAPNIGEFSHPRIEVMESEFYVGMEYVKANGNKVTMTEPQVLLKMEKEAGKRFSRDKINQGNVQLDVDFLMLGDTEEYKQYKNLETLNLYDTVIVKTGPSGFTLTNMLQVSGYEYDAILERYNKINLSWNVNKKRKFGSVGGHILADHGIGFNKLSQSLRRRLKRG